MGKGNLVIGQSGGPTPVINASLIGAVKEAEKHDCFGEVYGMRWGIQGFMQEELVDLSREREETLDLVARAPSSCLGSCRHKVGDEDLPRILEVLKKYDIHYFLMIGGDDTQNTTYRVAGFCEHEGYECLGIGIPKTVDNDLYGTDHTPGYGSAARYVALSMLQGGRLARDMQKVDPVSVYQAVGRDAGWLAASAALARAREQDPPHLIYVPEKPFERERFIKDAELCIKRFGFVSVVVGEGITYKDSKPVSGTIVRDKFGNPEFGAMGGTSAAVIVKDMVCKALGVRGEFQVVESLQMCAADRVSETDFEEAYRAGEEAVRLAAGGKTGLMVAFERAPGVEYKCNITAVPLQKVNESKKTMPDEFINQAGNFPTKAFLDYVRPLAGPVPAYGDLEFIKVKPGIRHS
ncbi:MAG: diphosphate--fructose-6-phosphate 1-phosphotransferase [Deltaproteobacteria bacterium]|nr:diphosphate--fructose-6-phosphate 1-phosphotransferase [Deltaproteobacteria bacterium]